jgi:hypothetical protein
MMWFILGPIIVIALILSYTMRPEWPNNEPVASTTPTAGGRP